MAVLLFMVVSAPPSMLYFNVPSVVVDITPPTDFCL